jgi:hypothetical protein
MPRSTPSRTTNNPAGRRVIGLDDLARRAGTRIRRPVLIVCEGEQTEQLYLNALRTHYRLATVDVRIHGEGAGPLEVVECALDLIAERRRIAKRDRDAPPPYEEAWCVFDREASNEPRGFREAVQLAARHKIRLAISNPSFEYWYLLHFAASDRPFHDGQEIKAELRRHIAGYSEAMDVFHLLRERTAEAHDRAEQLYTRHPDRERDPYPNPSTLVYQLVGGIIGMAAYRR